MDKKNIIAKVVKKLAGQDQKNFSIDIEKINDSSAELTVQGTKHPFKVPMTNLLGIKGFKENIFPNLEKEVYELECKGFWDIETDPDKAKYDFSNLKVKVNKSWVDAKSFGDFLDKKHSLTEILMEQHLREE